MAGSDVEARLRALEDRISSLELAGPPNTALSPGLEALLEHINTRLDIVNSGLVQTNHHHAVLERRFAGFSSDVEEINELNGLRHPRDEDSHSSSLTNSSTTDMNNNNLPDGVSAQIAYLFNRINRLSALIKPDGCLSNQINNLTTHVDHVAAHANAITTNVNGRFTILTNALTTNVTSIEARLDDLKRLVDRRFEHQAAHFLLQIKRFTADLHTQVQEIITQSDRLTALFKSVHVEDLSVQVQEIAHDIANMSENVNEEPETI
ncbi:MAG: hypothetical protein Q9224_001931, partial [Gallowayella concinna]